MARKKKIVKKKARKKANFRKMLSDDRVPKVLGLAALLTCLFFFIAFVSYLITWKADQSEVLEFSWDLILKSNIHVENTLGRLGAVISHQFFYKWFGVTSFVFVGILFTTGINLLFKKRIFPLKRIYRYTLYLLLWLTTTLSFVFYQSGFPYGGAFGNGINTWLNSFLGKVGTGLILAFALVLFLVIAYNFDIGGRLLKLFKRKESSISEIPEADDFDEVVLPKDIIERENLEYNEKELPEVTLTTEPEPEPEPVKEVVTAGTNGTEVHHEEIKLDIEESVEEEINEEHHVATNYDPTLDLPKYKYPEVELLEDYGDQKISIDKEELEKNKDQIIETLNNYNIQISKIKATVGPTVTLYEIVPAPGVRISKIKNLEDDIALSLAALGIRIIAPIPGKGTIGIEVPNARKEIVPMRSLVASEKFISSRMDLPIALGKTITNENFITDLTKMPHVLMAGATGQGKSVGINVILTSLLYKKHPSQLKFVLIDPKKVELSLYKKIEKHFLAILPGEEDAIVTNTRNVVKTLQALSIEMDARYELLKEAHVRNIKEYNEKFVKRRLNPEKGHRHLPFIVLVIDEFADLIMTAGKEVETPLTRLAQLSRAVGIHLVIATQRPSVNIITGTIKANFPVRIAFKVTAKVDSRTILDVGGAEQLIGRGDMLLSIGGNTIRLQCAFVDTHEVERVCAFIGDQQGYTEPFLLPEYVDENEGGSGQFSIEDRDDMFNDAARIVVMHQQGSTSLIQRRLKLGYNRAGRIIDQLEAAGIVGHHEGSKAREVLIHDESELEQFLKNLP